MIEFEKKILLTKEEYTCLLHHFGDKNQPVKQINYYFDTKDLFMHRQGITCRIRLKNGTYVATMKQHTPNSDFSTEKQLEVRAGLDDNSFVDMGLELQGELITNRCPIIKNDTCEAVLDKNDYLGYTDYELEIEYLAGHEAEANAIMQDCIRILQHNNLSLTPEEINSHSNKVPNKSNRFFERKSQN